MELIAVQLEVPKESKDVVDLLAKIGVQVKDGVQVEDIYAVIGELTNALAGMDKIPDEIKSAQKKDLAAYMVKQIMGIFE